MPNNVVPMNQVMPMQCDTTPCQLPPWGPFPPPFFGPSQPPWYPGANAGVTFSLTAPVNVIRGHFWWDGNVLHMFDGVAWVIIGGDGSIDGGGGTTPPSGAGTVVISDTPPGNPVSGMQWWNGSILQVWDGFMWKPIGPGQAAGPVPSTTQVFTMTQGTTLTMPTNAWAVVPFSTTPQVDTTLGFDAATKKFRPTKAGVYNFMARALGGPNGIGIAICKNDDGALNDLVSDTITAISSVGIVAGGPSNWMTAYGMTVMNGSTDYVRVFGFSGDGTFNGIGSNPVFSAWLFP
jgi:hypothetical protein